jgi:Nif-specific regulatory protein
MGRLYTVQDQLLCKQLVLKMSKSSVDASQQTALADEYAILNNLRHAGIPETCDFGVTASGEAYFTMMPAAGKPILDWWQTLTVIPASKRLAKLLPLLADILQTLDFIHRHNILHGDIKSSHWFADDATTARTTLIDFGMAKEFYSIADSKPATSQGGTLLYASPEVLACKPADERSDLYSLGVVIYELLYGRLPHTNGNTLTTASEVVKKRMVEEPEFSMSDWDEDIIKVVRKLLCREPARRYAGAFEALNDLQKSFGGQLINISPVLRSLAPLVHQAKADELKNLVPQVAAGHPCILRVEGAVGSGKSWLLGELKRHVQMCGGLWLNLNASTETDLLKQLAVWQSGVMPDADAGAVLPTDTPIEKTFLFDVIWTRIQNVLRKKLVVICADDAEQLTEERKELLDFLAKNMLLVTKQPFMLAIGKYPDDSAFCESFANYAPVKNINLTGISLAAYAKAVEMAAIDLDRDVLTMLYEKTNADLGLTERILSNWIAEQKLVRKSYKWQLTLDHETLLHENFLQSITELDAEQLETLSATEKKIVEWCVLMNGLATRQALQDLCTDVSPDEKNAAIETLMQKKILNVVHGRFQLTNPVTAQKTSTEITDKPARNLAIATYLEMHQAADSQITADVLATHFAETTLNEKAYSYSLKAAKTFQQEANFRKAKRFFEQARTASMALPLSATEEFELLYALQTLYDNLSLKDLFQRAIEELQILADRTADITCKLKAMEAKAKFLNTTSQFAALLNWCSIWEQTATDAGIIVSIISSIRYKANAVVVSAGQYDDAKRFYEQALALADEHQLIQEQGICHHHLGRFLLNYTSDRTAAEEHFEKALECFEKTGDKKFISQIVFLKALTYTKWAEYAKAESLYIQALQMMQEQQDTLGMSGVYAAIGDQAMECGDFGKTMVYYQKALTIRIARNNKRGEAVMFSNIGGLLVILGQYEPALQMFRQSQRLKTELNDIRGKIFDLNNIGTLYQEAGRFEEARQCLAEAAQTVDQLGNLELAAEIYNTFTCIETDEDHAACDSGQAVIYARKAIDAAEKGHFEMKRTSVIPNLVIALIAVGKMDEARTIIEVSQSDLSKYGSDTQSSKFQYELFKIYEKLGKPTWAMQSIERAYQLVMSAAKKITDPHHRESFLSLAKPNQRILAAHKAFLSNRSQRGLGIIYEISRRINSPQKADEVLAEIFKLVSDVMRADRSIIFLFNEVGVLEPKVVEAIETETLSDAFKISTSILNDVRQKGLAFIAPDAQMDESLQSKTSITKFSILSLACVPIKNQDRVIGTIYMDSRSATNIFSPQDVVFVEAFANLAGIAIENAKLREQLLAENEHVRLQRDDLARQMLATIVYDGLLGKSESMQKIYRLIKSASMSMSNVLISGELGTGKEVTAKAIHYNSPRKEKKFITVDCGAISESLLESELFGHKKNAFTGAASDRAGLFEEANGGTIFLDEINSTSINFQTKILRIIESGEVRRLGENEYRKINIRIIAATNQNLVDLIKDGKFRGDLYYRLNVIEINLPPLRERQADIPELIQHFIKKSAEAGKGKTKAISKAAVEVLCRYEWPGNVRELRNMIEQLLSTNETETVIEVRHLPETLATTIDNGKTEVGKNRQFISESNLVADSAVLPEGIGLKNYLAEIEKQIITATLQKHHRHQANAAKELKIAASSLTEKIKKYDIN